MIRWCDRHEPAVRLSTGTRCWVCAKEREAQRQSRHARGYGAAHVAARRALADTLPAACHYCRHVVTPEMRWVAAHLIDGEATSPRVVAHSICNERAKVRRGWTTVGYTL